MGTVSIVDDLIKRLGVNLKKLIGFDSVKEIVEPLAYNNGIDDYNAIINPIEEPEKKPDLPSFSSNKGVGIIVTLVLGIIITSPILIPSVLILAILLALRGVFNPYKNYKKVLPPRVDKKKKD